MKVEVKYLKLNSDNGSNINAIYNQSFKKVTIEGYFLEYMFNPFSIGYFYLRLLRELNNMYYYRQHFHVIFYVATPLEWVFYHS